MTTTDNVIDVHVIVALLCILGAGLIVALVLAAMSEEARKKRGRR